MRSESQGFASLGTLVLALVYYMPVVVCVIYDVFFCLRWWYLYWWWYSGGGGVMVVVTAAVRVAVPILVGLLYLNVFWWGCWW